MKYSIILFILALILLSSACTNSPGELSINRVETRMSFNETQDVIIYSIYMNDELTNIEYEFVESKGDALSGIAFFGKVNFNNEVITLDLESSNYFFLANDDMKNLYSIDEQFATRNGKLEISIGNNTNVTKSDAGSWTYWCSCNGPGGEAEDCVSTTVDWGIFCEGSCNGTCIGYLENGGVISDGGILIQTSAHITSVEEID